MTRKTRHDMLTAMAFISPWLLGLIVFTLYPLSASLYLSFNDYDVLSKPVFVGAENYTDMAGDTIFWRSLYNTLIYAMFAIPLGLFLSLMVAVLLNQAARGQSIFRTLFFLPSIVPLIAVAMVWMWIFQAEGLLNAALQPLFTLIGKITGQSLDGPAWLTEAAWTKPTLILAGLWQIGGTVVIFLAALQDVPRSLYESADLDGAGPAHKLWHITVPIISPVIYFNLVMGIISALQVFVTPFVLMPDGGAERSALFYAVYLYNNAFQYSQMGYACALAWVLFVLIASLTWVATMMSRRHIYYAGA